MEYRKIIKFGNSSFAVCLPKEWVQKNNLKKGNSVYMDLNGTGEITVSPKLIEKVKEKKGITIDINNKDIYDIKREIVCSYLNNYHNIVVTGNNMSEKATGIRDILNELVALEIMEQTNKRIVAKDFLDMENISLQNTVRKIDMTLRSTIYDIKTLAREGKKVSEIASSRDKDVNRLALLCMRTIRYGISNTSFIKKSRMNATEMLDINQIVILMEKVGDETKRIARHMDLITKSKTSNEQMHKAIDLFTEIENLYVQAMKSFYKKDRSLAFETAKNRAFLKNRIQDFSAELVGEKKNNYLAEKLNTMLTYIHDITRVSYQ